MRYEDAGNISAEDGVFRKITWRLLPFLLICYVAAYLDRINIGFASLQMKEDLNLSDGVYGLGAGIFFAGYCLFEVPSNLLLERVGARRTLTRIMVLWGLTSAAMLVTRSPAMFYGLRFLLGVFEAGFFPGMILYLTYWYPANRRAKVMALFLTATAFAGVLGGPLSGYLMTRLAGSYGLAGWQWMFLCEGLPSCVLGVVAFFYLSDKPLDVSWLTAAEKQTVCNELLRDEKTSPIFRGLTFGQALKTPRVYGLAFAYFTFICGVYVISFWLPVIIRGAGISNPLSIGFLTAIPYGFAVATMVIVCRHSDARGERRIHTALCALIGATSLALVTATGSNLITALVVLSVGTSAIFTLQPLLWALATDSLGGTRAAAGTIATINSIGLVGGFVSPAVLGWIKTETGNFNYGMYFIALLLIMGALLSLRFRRDVTL